MGADRSSHQTSAISGSRRRELYDARRRRGHTGRDDARLDEAGVGVRGRHHQRSAEVWIARLAAGCGAHRGGLSHGRVDARSAPLALSEADYDAWRRAGIAPPHGLPAPAFIEAEGLESRDRRGQMLDRHVGVPLNVDSVEKASPWSRARSVRDGDVAPDSRRRAGLQAPREGASGYAPPS